MVRYTGEAVRPVETALDLVADESAALPSGRSARNGGGRVIARSTAHRPERTCVGCRQAAPREQLVRLVREPAPDGVVPRVRVDPTGSAPGRGAWLHPDASCLDLALRRGGPARSFRGRVDTGLLARDLEAFEPTRTWNR